MPGTSAIPLRRTSPGIGLRAALVGLTLSLLSSPLPAVDWFPSLDAARKANPDDDRPVVIVFGSQSCGWCRKLAADTLASSDVAEIAERFSWVKADVDEQAELAARYGVRGLPDTVVIDRNGHVLGERAGYLPAAAYVEFLLAALANPAPTAREIDALLAELGVDDESRRRLAVQQLVERMARFDATGREQALDAVNEATPQLWVELAAHLADERLAHRAAAAGFLLRAVPRGPQFDPFASADEQRRQRDDWRDWFAAQGLTVPAPPPSPAPAGPASDWAPSDGPPPPPVARAVSAPT